jgi:DNA replication protein DnaC
MLLQQTLERLHEMRLGGMAQALTEQLQTPEHASLSFEDRLALLVEREQSYRADRRLQRLLQEAKLRLPASIEDLDFRAPRGLERGVVLRLASCDWIRQHQVVLIIGPTGVGKSYLACALAHSACRQGLRTRYYRLGRLLGDLSLARADGSYPKLLDRLGRSELLVLDDFGLAPLTDSERHDLLEVLEDRTGRRSTLVTSQLPLEHWHEALGNPTLADAILDRLVHHAHVVVMKGGSMPKLHPAVDAVSAINA